MFAKIYKMTITDKAIKVLGKDRTNLNELAILFRKSEVTIRRWIKNKDTRLTTVDAIAFIKSKTGLTQSEILN